MHTLTEKERQTLIALINEAHGCRLSRAEFADAVLLLFEDISGFEAISPTEANLIVNVLWRKYHGQESIRKA